MFFTVVVFSTAAPNVEACLDYETTLKSVTEKRPSWRHTDERTFRYERHPKNWIRDQSIKIPEPLTWQHPNTGRYADEWTTVKLRKTREFDDRNCSNFLYKTFSANGGIIGVTIGRLPEYCSESPALVWYDKNGAMVGSVKVIPMYNMNIETLWCVQGFTLFGLEAHYEGGGRADMLVIWHVSSNQWIFFQTPEKRIFDLIPNWLEADAEAVGNTILLSKGNKTIAIRPFEAKWNLK